MADGGKSRVDILAISAKGWNKQISGKRGRKRSFLLFSTKKRGRNKEKVREEIWNFGQNIYPRGKYSDLDSWNCTKGIRWSKKMFRVVDLLLRPLYVLGGNICQWSLTFFFNFSCDESWQEASVKICCFTDKTSLSSPGQAGIIFGCFYCCC